MADIANTEAGGDPVTVTPESLKTKLVEGIQAQHVDIEDLSGK